MGVSDFLPQPITHGDLEHSLRGLIQRASASAPSTKSGTVITVFRPVGGTGATTIATHLALAMASDQTQNVALVDLDLQNGAVGLYLDIATDVGVVNCLDRFQDLDPGLVRSVSVKHASGTDVLVATHSQRPLDAYPPQAIEKLLETMRRAYDVVIVDTPPGWTQWHGALIAHTELAVIVLQKTVANLRLGRKLVTALKDEHLSSDQIVTVCNRVPQTWFSRDISHTDATAALGAKVDLTLPSDYSLVSEAANLGVHVSRIRAGTKFEKGVVALAAELGRRISQRQEKMLAVTPETRTDAHVREAS
jgi:pilus assembly protein CpaE